MEYDVLLESVFLIRIFQTNVSINVKSHRLSV